MSQCNERKGAEDVAEDLNDPAVQARYDEFVKNRHYPADTYRIQDGCANCRHVSKRETCDGATFFCTFLDAPMDEPWREVVAQGICGEWAKR